MKFNRFFTVVDSHTAGNPTRVVIGGGAKIPGKTIAEKRDYFMENMDHIRRMLVEEPRGHKGMFVAFLVPPTMNEADVGVLFMGSRYPDMCGHGTIGVTTVLIETGMVAVKESTTEINLDTPAGLVRAKAKVTDGLVDSVTFRNIPSFFIEERRIRVPDIGNIKVDVAFGGNFYVLVSEEEISVKVNKKNINELIAKGSVVKSAAEKQVKLHHPNSSIMPEIAAVMICGSPGNPKADGRNILIGRNSVFDRSPCGTGTCARMASLYAKGKLKLNEEFIHESIIGSLFKGRLIQETKVGQYAAVIPEITGSAYITGFNNIVCSANDPYKSGFFI